jgi:VWFA-related protein
MSKYWISLLTILLLLPLVLVGQESNPQKKFGVRVNVVSLDVEVLDQNGNQIQGLNKSDFIVEENGKPVSISHFAVSTDMPVSLVAILDTSTINTEQLGICKRFLLIFAHELAHKDEICLYSFDAKNAYLEQDLTTDRPLLMKALDNIGVLSKRTPGALVELFGPIPRTAIAVDLGLLKLRNGHNGKKALLLISNRFRGLGPVTVEHVQQSGCTLITLAFPHKTTMLVSLGGDEISARQLMRESGGRQFSAESADIEKLSQKVAYSLKNYYSIGYLAEIKAGDTKPRKIRIRVPGRKCTIHYRHTFIPG